MYTQNSTREETAPCLTPLQLFASLKEILKKLNSINVKKAEPIGPEIFVGHHVTTGKVYQ